MSEAAVPPAPHMVQQAFLEPDHNRAMLDYALASREQFAPSLVAGGKLDPDTRASRSLKDLGPFAPLLRERLTERLPTLLAGTGTRPFELASIELEFVAYGEGAHFQAHRDIPIGNDRQPLGGDGSHKADRILSAVYYLHREPKAFTGGELRLHRFGSNGAPGDYVDLPPAQNSLVVFPSWLVHEVLRVSCPTDAFEDHRFAVNCWLCRTAKEKESRRADHE